MASGLRYARTPTVKFIKLQSTLTCDCCKKITHRNYSIQAKQLAFRNRTQVPFQINRRLLLTGTSHFKSWDQTQSIPATQDPFKLVREDMDTLCTEIQDALITGHEVELEDIAQYHFDGKGKSFRPMVVMLMARACNLNENNSKRILIPSQKKVAMIAEMIHTASLIHDDVIDSADTRRGKPSVQSSWGQKKAILAGDFILSVSSKMLARIRNDEVVDVLAKVLEDLVRGEFMQLGSKEDENERFSHYLKKTFKKTASLLANSCKAVAILADNSDEVIENCYQYGKNIGIAFQLIDDLLDFISSEDLMGKPTAADLKLGLATAPVLFAAQEYPELNPLIMRRFTLDGDIERTRDLVAKSDGVAHTKMLAEQHCKEAVKNISKLYPSLERQGLINIIDMVLNRLK